MSDRELLEKAARAAGLLNEPHDWAHGVLRLIRPAGSAYWNPLTDNGDALQLAVTLRMEVTIREGHTWADIGSGQALDKQMHGTDAMAATRRAIVRAAASLGEKP